VALFSVYYEPKLKMCCLIRFENITLTVKVNNSYYHDVKLPSLNADTHTQPFYGSMDFVWDNLGELVPEETFTQVLSLNAHTTFHVGSGRQHHVTQVYTGLQTDLILFADVGIGLNLLNKA